MTPPPPPSAGILSPSKRDSISSSSGPRVRYHTEWSPQVPPPLAITKPNAQPVVLGGDARSYILSTHNSQVALQSPGSAASAARDEQDDEEEEFLRSLFGLADADAGPSSPIAEVVLGTPHPAPPLDWRRKTMSDAEYPGEGAGEAVRGMRSTFAGGEGGGGSAHPEWDSVRELQERIRQNEQVHPHCSSSHAPILSLYV